ncbi:ATP-grasp domain-containing protein [Streptomyces qinglanensis]|uniref:ATP-grasp domain-containing protein n=1 Tax=Streptomyces qinglanensis TaxID=943816 RepID=UPI003D72E98D
MPPPLLLLIGSGPEPMRRSMLHSAATDTPLVLIDDAEPTWQIPYVVDYEVTDLRSLSGVVRAAETLARRWDIGGVLTFDEHHLMAAARLGERIGLPGNSVTSILATRDKATSRYRFAAADVPSAAFTWVHSVAAAASAVERLGDFPVVLKPSAHAGGTGVVRVNTLADLPAGWDVASEGATRQGAEGQGVLLEEYLNGGEVAVETVTEHGDTTAIAVIRKNVAFAPYFEASRHLVTASDPLLAQVAPFAAAAVRALDITHGVSDVEMKLTTTGPRLIEVNACLPGDRISDLVHLATGVDLTRAAAALASGNRPNLERTRDRSATIGMIYPPDDGVVAGLALRRGDNRHLKTLRWLCDTGDYVTLSPSPQTPNSSRAGFAIVTGDTPDQARTHLDDVLDRAVVNLGSAQSHTA